MKSSHSLYEVYHTDRQDERLELFSILRTEFAVSTGLYPGCFVHVTPSFVIPQMHYVDSDKRAKTFFQSGAAGNLITQRKMYVEEPTFSFELRDYREEPETDPSRFDLLISQYARFVSLHCTQHLRIGGHLVANNSHGDATLATCDPRFRLRRVISRRGENFRLLTDNLVPYVTPKSSTTPIFVPELREFVLSRGRGVAYQRLLIGHRLPRNRNLPG